MSWGHGFMLCSTPYSSRRMKKASTVVARKGSQSVAELVPAVNAINSARAVLIALRQSDEPAKPSAKWFQVADMLLDDLLTSIIEETLTGAILIAHIAELQRWEE